MSKLQEQLESKKQAEINAIVSAAADRIVSNQAAVTEKKVPSYKIIKANRIANAAGYLLKPSNTGFYTPKDQEEFDLLEYFCTTGHLEKV